MSEKVGTIRKLYRKMLYRDIDKVYAKHFGMRQMPKKNKKLLDVGMGFGFDIITKHREGYSCYGIDLDKSRIEKTREMFRRNGVDAELKVGSATRLPFKKNFFDDVICFHVIEHVKEDEKAIREIHRVLRKGGVLHLRVPHIHNLHTKFHMMIGARYPYTDRTHVREYEKKQVADLIAANGFKIKSVSQSGFIPPVGLKFLMIASHYLPLDKLFQYLGEKFPKNSAEIKVVAVKK